MQLPDFNFTIERNVYLRITADGVEEIGLEPSVKHDGYAVFVYDETGWDALNLYMWGDTNNLNGDWPGMEVTGEQTINGITYKYFDMGEANTGLGENLIFSNAGASQLADFAYTIDHDVYLHITTAGVTEIDPATFQPGGETSTPAPGPGNGDHCREEQRGLCRSSSLCMGRQRGLRWMAWRNTSESDRQRLVPL